MDELTRRNSPKTPNSEFLDAEILPSPYMGREENGGRHFGGYLTCERATMNTHTAMANEQTPPIPEPVLRASEDSYRRGYWHGYGQALDDIAASTKRGKVWGRLATFYDTVLMRWRYAAHAGRVVRPPVYPDKS